MANFEGLASEWYKNEDLKLRGHDSHRLVGRAQGIPIAQDDQWHAVHNKAVLEPIIDRMRISHYIRTPYLEELEPEIKAFHALVATKGKLDWDNFPTLPIDDVAIHVCASGIKKILRYARKKFLSPHIPRDRCYKEQLVSLYDFVFKPIHVVKLYF